MMPLNVYSVLIGSLSLATKSQLCKQHRLRHGKLLFYILEISKKDCLLRLYCMNAYVAVP